MKNKISKKTSRRNVLIATALKNEGFYNIQNKKQIKCKIIEEADYKLLGCFYFALANMLLSLLVHWSRFFKGFFAGLSLALAIIYLRLYYLSREVYWREI